MTQREGDSVLAPDRSRSIPDAPAVAPAVSPEAAPPRATTEARWYDPPDDPDADMEATIDEECKRQGIARASLTATTPEPMTEDRYIELGAMHRAGWRGSHAFHYGRRVLSDLYNEVTRLRAPLAGAPSRESGALLDAYVACIGHDQQGAALARAALDRHLATLEQNAARMREALEFYGTQMNWMTPSVGFALQYDPEPSPISRDSGALARRALSPSGEPTTTPET